MTDALPTILLWGSTNVGKTSLLTLALKSSEVSKLKLDLQRSAGALRALNWRYDRLRTQLPMEPTSEGYVDLELTAGDGGRFRICDVRGGITHHVDTDAVDRIQSAAVVLFFVAWGTRDIEKQLRAVRAGAALCLDKPRGLVFTKCETKLDEHDPCWAAPAGWWQCDPELVPYADVLSGFGDSIWPTSCFGYHEVTGYPAVILGEFGQPMPWQIHPRQVHRPFEWALREIAAAREAT
jgi:GTPase SAR1 family protein